ncbi:tobamovirus multiplication-like protein [Actinidia rufa]|uniref:Tobamovirus multiplication-like protein n=1 Tax=Actinidia rufa TaxID=165716 RepID=A0A7J0GXZ3_9ERIC|nr:tobamovirus multiplication-like protein [Actinidia rufa]
MQYLDKAPTFDGRPDPKAFINWVNEMDHFFDWHKLSDDRKVRFAKLKLISRAKFFWYSIEAKRGQNPITDWIEMIEVLSNKYLPQSYQGDKLEVMEQKQKLEAMQKSKNQIIEVLKQIENISNELREIKMKRMQQFKKETKAAIIIQTHWRRYKLLACWCPANSAIPVETSLACQTGHTTCPFAPEHIVASAQLIEEVSHLTKMAPNIVPPLAVGNHAIGALAPPVFSISCPVPTDISNALI